MRAALEQAIHPKARRTSVGHPLCAQHFNMPSLIRAALQQAMPKPASLY